MASAGCNVACCCLGDFVRGYLSLRVQQLDVTVETKTLDSVFVKIVISVQYNVLPEKQYEGEGRTAGHLSLRWSSFSAEGAWRPRDTKAVGGWSSWRFIHAPSRSCSQPSTS